MITKEMYCRKIIDEFKKNNALTNSSDDELVGHIFSSTSLGIALEYLGILNAEKYPAEYDYISSRGGLKDIYYSIETETVNILTVREFIDLLPETFNEGE